MNHFLLPTNTFSAKRPTAKKTVLFYYPYNKSMAGGPRTVLNLLNGLDRSRFAPVFATQRESPLTEAVREHGIPVEVVAFPPILDVYEEGSFTYSLFQKMQSLAALVRYNMRLAHVAARHDVATYWARSARGVLMTFGAARAAGCSLVWDIGMEKEAEGLMRVFLGFGLCAATCIVTQARTQPAQIFGTTAARAFSWKFKAISPGLDEKRVADLRRAVAEENEAENPRPFTVLCIGTLQPRKNQRMLLEAAREILEETTDVRFDLVGSAAGDGYLEEMKRFVASHGIERQVRFLGWRDDVPQILAQSDVLVSCSRNEGLPHVIREAMYAGMPVVATPAGGVPEAILNGRTGWLVDHGDARQLGDRLLWLKARPQQRRAMGEASRARARSHFSQAAWIDGYNNLLECI